MRDNFVFFYTLYVGYMQNEQLRNWLVSITNNVKHWKKYESKYGIITLI